MKNIKKIIAVLVILGVHFMNFQIVAQTMPNKEINCFDNFEYNDSGNNLANTYLLAMLNCKMTPHLLLNLRRDSAAEAVALSQNNSEFEIEFKSRLEKWFNPNKHNPVIKVLRNVKADVNAPVTKQAQSRRTKRDLLKTELTPIGSNEKEKLVIEFFYESNGKGIDPEAMLISTKDYIIIAWRGTDRVSNTTPIVGGAIYEFGEWLETNPDMLLVPPPSSNISGLVHEGFNKSIIYGDILGKLANRLRELGVENKKLWITGHSLGGAHAQLSALYLKKMYNIQPFAVYAYASPAVGDQALANTLERVLPGTRLQRFIYRNDPVPRLPSGMTLPYARAGILNHYSSEQGSNNYHFDKSEQREFPSPFICHHHSQWYARAAFYELIDNRPSLEGKIPEAPPAPTEFCTPLDVSEENGSTIVQSFFGIDQDMEPGTYYIMNAKTKKYLNIKAGETNSNGKPFRMNSLSTSNRFKWNVENIPAGVLGGYVIKCKSGSKVIDADRGNVGGNNSGVQTWNRLPAVVGILRNHQEWEIERLDNGRFHIKNMLNNQYVLNALDNGRVVLDNNKGLGGQWFFVKVAN
ncbi:MAG: RICIN domain-containing protein [Maribacter sp.]|uniref:lipase family protein n=1 Tax=Maribacter sp. TaxID=1897614 RepID=UPI003C76CD19